ncbi:MAG: hypothetical protein R2824_12180 [Saprospiraceae bacterium]|nr:hypothetical protein [Lewinella sp.]
MFSGIQTSLSLETTLYQIKQAGQLLPVTEIIRLWSENADFRAFYNDLLAASPFPAYFWELPPVTLDTLELPFEFVLVNSTTLARVQANSRPFHNWFTDEPVVVFPNIGGDATLVVPTPKVSKNTYTHLAQFVRHAPEEQIDRFWQEVGRTYHKNLSNQKLWLSTSGLGVYWLHIRLDSRPKYYTHEAYRQ